MVRPTRPSEEITAAHAARRAAAIHPLWVGAGFAVALGCGDPDAVFLTGDDEAVAAPREFALGVATYALSSQLPACNRANLGSVSYVQLENQFYYCDGKAQRPIALVGTPGADGLSWLVATSAAGPVQCGNGGLLIAVGPDRNRNGVLDAAEVASSSAVCNGADGEDGAPGPQGVPGRDGRDGRDATAAACVITDNGNGTQTITCPGGSVTVSSGAHQPPPRIITGDVTIHTQSELHALADVVEITGRLQVAGSVTDLSDLMRLNHVGGDLVISTLLPSLRGLDGLRSVGGSVRLEQNEALRNADALGNLRSIGRNLELNNNSALTRLPVFNSLQALSGLVIENSALTSLSGLERVQVVQLLTISGNRALTNLRGLEGIQGIHSTWTIRYNESLTSLEGLEGLEIIDTASLIIEQNDALTSLQGLSSLRTLMLGELFIRDNPALTSLDGLDSLDSDQEMNVTISGNSSLTSLAAFNGLQSIGLYYGALHIENNDALVNLNGLESLETFSHLTIRGNAALLRLDALSALREQIGGSLTISENPSLTSLEGLSALHHFANLTIQDNDALTSLSGLDGARTTWGDLSILDNAGLTSLTGLGGIQYVGYNRNGSPTGGSLNISRNAALTRLQALSSLVAVSTDLEVSNNTVLPPCEAERLRNAILVGGAVMMTGNTGSASCASTNTGGEVASVGGGVVGSP
jgi:hypothetical protein